MKLLVSFGNGLKPFLHLLFSSRSVFSHPDLLTLCHTHGLQPFFTFKCEYSTHKPSTLRASPNATTPPNNNKKWQAKARWTVTEVVGLVMVLSDQKCISNSLRADSRGPSGEW